MSKKSSIGAFAPAPAAIEPRRRPGRQPDSGEAEPKIDDRKGVMIRLTTAQHLAVQHLRIELGVTMQDACVMGLNLLFTAQGLPPIDAAVEQVFAGKLNRP